MSAEVFKLMAVRKPTSSVVEALICQCFRISASKQSISLLHASERTRLNIQLSHGADHRASEGRGLIGSIGTHLCCLNKGFANHGLRQNRKLTRLVDRADV